MTAKPFTREELARHFGPNLRARIEATVKQGWARKQPTLDELDRWAAEEIMGWWQEGITLGKPNTPSYWTYRDQHVDMGKIIDIKDWQPTERLGQALACLHEAGWSYELKGSTKGNALLYVERGGFMHAVYDGNHYTARIAEAIVRHLRESTTMHGMARSCDPR